MKQEKMKDSGRNCPACSHRFDSSDWKPKIIPCGHTLCTKCVSDCVEDTEVPCPTCNKNLCEAPGATGGVSAETKETFVPLKEEISRKVEFSSAKIEERKAHLLQYIAFMEETVRKHEDCADRYRAIANAHREMAEFMQAERKKIAAALKKGKEERRKMKQAKKNLLSAKTPESLIPAVEEVIESHKAVGNWSQEAQNNFPDTNLLTRSLKLREKTQGVLRVLSAAEQEAAEAAAIAAAEAVVAAVAEEAASDAVIAA